MEKVHADIDISEINLKEEDCHISSQGLELKNKSINIEEENSQEKSLNTKTYIDSDDSSFKHKAIEELNCSDHKLELLALSNRVYKLDKCYYFITIDPNAVNQDSQLSKLLDSKKKGFEDLLKTLNIENLLNSNDLIENPDSLISTYFGKEDNHSKSNPTNNTPISGSMNSRNIMSSYLICYYKDKGNYELLTIDPIKGSYDKTFFDNKQKSNDYILERNKIYKDIETSTNDSKISLDQLNEKDLTKETNFILDNDKSIKQTENPKLFSILNSAKKNEEEAKIILTIHNLTDKIKKLDEAKKLSFQTLINPF